MLLVVNRQSGNAGQQRYHLPSSSKDYDLPIHYPGEGRGGRHKNIRNFNSDRVRSFVLTSVSKNAKEFTESEIAWIERNERFFSVGREVILGGTKKLGTLEL